MLTWKQALRRHSFVQDAAAGVEVVGEQVWSGVTGKAGAATGLMADASADTTPADYATLVAVDDIPAGYAAVCILEAYKAARDQGQEPRTPRDARVISHAGWRKFRELADQGGWLEHGTGGDLSASWPGIHLIQQGKADPEKLKQIAMLAGRMHKALRGAKSKRVEGIPEEVVGVEMGSDFTALVPSEYALLATDPTKRELFRRMLARETVQFKRVGKEKKARGPLVIALDESGSMTGQPEVWSKAAMTALTRLAWEDKRPVVVVHFSTATKAVRLNPGDIGKLVQAQQTFLDGGTNIGVALEVALDEVQELAKAGVKGADIVLVSDGGDAGGKVDRAMDALDKLNVRMWSVAIGVPFTGALKARAAAYVFLTPENMDDPNSVLKVGESVGV